MDITRALQEVEAMITSASRGGGAGGGKLERALESIVKSGLGRNLNLGTNASSSGGGGQSEDEEAESEYALNVMLSLSKLSDARFSTYFSCLKGMGVSVEEAHKRVQANRSSLAFRHNLFSANPRQDADAREVEHLDKNFRVYVEDHQWPQVFNLLLRSTLMNPVLDVKIVTDERLLSSRECFLEVRSQPMETLSIKLDVGADNMEDPAFLVPMLACMRVLSRGKAEAEEGADAGRGEGAYQAPRDGAMRMLIMAQVSQQTLQHAYEKGALGALIPSPFTVPLLCAPLQSLENLTWWVDSLHDRAITDTAAAATDLTPKILLLGGGSSIYALSLAVAWLLLDKRAAPVDSMRRERACKLLTWMCSFVPSLRAEEREDRESAVSSYCRLFCLQENGNSNSSTHAHDSTTTTSTTSTTGSQGGRGEKRKVDGEERLSQGKATKVVYPPGSACVLACMAAAALGILPMMDDGEYPSEKAEKEKWLPWMQVVVQVVEQPVVENLTDQMKRLLEAKDSALASILVQMVSCPHGESERNDAIRESVRRVGSMTSLWV